MVRPIINQKLKKCIGPKPFPTWLLWGKRIERMHKSVGYSLPMAWHLTQRVSSIGACGRGRTELGARGGHRWHLSSKSIARLSFRSSREEFDNTQFLSHLGKIAYNANVVKKSFSSWCNWERDCNLQEKCHHFSNKPKVYLLEIKRTFKSLWIKWI